eukprot:scaffold572_cov66-Skeletonema_marinoi.AAC.1
MPAGPVNISKCPKLKRDGLTFFDSDVSASSAMVALLHTTTLGWRLHMQSLSHLSARRRKSEMIRSHIWPQEMLPSARYASGQQLSSYRRRYNVV